MTGPVTFTDYDGRAYRVLGGRNYRPVASYWWSPPPGFYRVGPKPLNPPHD